MNARGEDGDSPLHIACLYGQTAVVEECIKRGADVNVRDEDDSTPLHDAAAGGFEAIVAQLLLKGASTSVKDNEEDTPIHHAARGGHAAVVAQLLTACSDRTALQHGQACRPSQRLSSAPAPPQDAPGAWWLWVRLISAPKERGRPTGRPATALATRARRLRGR